MEGKGRKKRKKRGATAKHLSLVKDPVLDYSDSCLSEKFQDCPEKDLTAYPNPFRQIKNKSGGGDPKAYALFPFLF